MCLLERPGSELDSVNSEPSQKWVFMVEKLTVIEKAMSFTHFCVRDVTCSFFWAVSSRTANAYECSTCSMVSRAGEWTNLWYTVENNSSSVAPCGSAYSTVSCQHSNCNETELTQDNNLSICILIKEYQLGLLIPHYITQSL
jgi:hypothetical protein